MHFRHLLFEQYYLADRPVLSLAAACELTAAGDIRRACISDRMETLQQLVEQGSSLEVLAGQLGVALLDFSAPWRLQPVHIAKPWGQEIWYTGIEARGVSRVASSTGTTPLPWAIALGTQRVLGNQSHVNLLKILDPLPDAVFGDLYFELHEQKREVYVVTHVDETAWPAGVGAIRFGFSQEKRAQFADDASFVAAYRDAVSIYRLQRREIDGHIDVLRIRDGFTLNEPVSSEKSSQWLAELPLYFLQREAELRVQMESFTGLRELRAGDALAVPLLTPHALQHGVRTVEFQTPVYERKILSFAQKVLTQEHWDTEEALQLAKLQAPALDAFPVLRDANGVKMEEIVAFDDFSVMRVYLEPGANFVYETAGDYALLMAVSGDVVCAEQALLPEQALLFPAALEAVALKNTGEQQAVVLLAKPAD